jgi:hypothetical protein
MDGKESLDSSDDGAGLFPEDDFDLDEHLAWLVREIDAGRIQPPPEQAVHGPAASLSLGDACDVDPALLAAMSGPAGLGGEAVSAAFGQDEAADVLCPGPVLAVLTAQAVTGAAALADSELIGALQAARRLASHAEYQQTVVIAEFARRRQERFEAAKSAGRPVGCREGEFPGEELAMELIDTRVQAGLRIDTAVELASRLPRTLAAMAAGQIDLGRATTIAARTLIMTDADAAYADEVLAAVAPGLRPDQLAAKAARLEEKLAPEAVRARKEQARQLDQRVEARREASGNASLAARELATVDAMASKAYIDAIAVKLRNSGLVQGTMGQLRALALTDLTQGRNPLDRISGRPLDLFKSEHDDGGSGGWPGWDPADAADPGLQDRLADERDNGPRRPVRPSEPVPLPALISLVVPAATLFGFGTHPATAAGWGLLDAGETQAVVQAASRHPRSRWCVTVIGTEGTAVAHGCAHGRHRWPENAPGSGDPPQAARLLELLCRLNVTLEPIAAGACDHDGAENCYVPSRKLKHLIRARNQLCTAPGCNAQAVHCDIDHTVPYPDGLTEQCNLNPKCRRHHRVKQAPDWTVTQPAPGTATWTTPSGRVHSTTATAYDV